MTTAFQEKITWKLKTHFALGLENKKPYKCEIKGDMIRQVASEHDDKRPFKRELYDFRCSFKSNMNKHVTAVHEKKNQFKCEMYDYSCFLKCNMSRRVGLIDGKNESSKSKIF